MQWSQTGEERGEPDVRVARRSRYVLSLLCGLLLLSQNSLLAQGQAAATDSIDWRIGATALLGLTTHSIDLDIYHGSAGCGVFQDQLSLHAEGRFTFEKPIVQFGSIPVDLFAGLSYRDRSLSFSESSSSPGRGVNGEEQTIVTQHRYEAALSGFGGMLGLVVEPITGLRVGAAPTLTLVSVGDTRQYEQIVSPLGASFTETDDFERPVDRGGLLSYRSLLPGLTAWTGLRLLLSNDLGLEPQVGVDLDLLSIEESYPWRTTRWYLGLSFFRQKVDGSLQGSDPLPPPTLLAEAPTPPPAPPEAVIASSLEPVVEPPYLEAKIVAFGIDDAGNKYPDPVIEITEAPTTWTIPVIPYLFFDSGSASIPWRYYVLEDREESATFLLDSLLDLKPMTIHHHLLNVLGERLRERPDVSMTIVGTHSSDEPSDSLALVRADSLREYFVRVWGIDRRRLSTQAGEPYNRSSGETPEGRAENRRAEFRFDGESLLSPVTVERLARIASPPAITFEKEVYADTALSRLVVRVMQGKKELLRFVEGESASNPSSRFWPLSDLRVNRDLTPVRYRFEVTDVTGQKAVDEGEFRVLERVTRTDDEPIEINEYLLAGFVYNSADLSPQHVSAIYEIARIAGESAWIEIAGFTDEVGDAERNRQLASDRANNVAERLRSARRDLRFDGEIEIEVRGSGETDRVEFDNNLPEGRIFSRMVRVTIHRRGE